MSFIDVVGIAITSGAVAGLIGAFLALDAHGQDERARRRQAEEHIEQLFTSALTRLEQRAKSGK